MSADQKNATLPCRRPAAPVLFPLLCAFTGLLGAFFIGKETILWREMSAPLLLGTIALAGAVLLHAWSTASARSALLFFVLATGIPLAAEYAGIRWGVPFGMRFWYHEDLRPRLFGVVPLFIPLSWMVLAYVPIVVLRRMGPEPPLSPRAWLPKALAAAAMICIGDLSLDPLAVAVGAWTWERPGPYFGIPASNYLGWFLVGFLVYGSFFTLERPSPPRPPALVCAYDLFLVAAALSLAVLGHVAVVRHVPGGAWIIPITAVTGAPGLLFWVKHRRPPAPGADPG